MVKKSNLASMTVDALFKLRDDIADVLSAKMRGLRKDLAKFGNGPVGKGKRRGPKKGKKVAPKYRGPKGELWSGRGLKPRWLAAEMKRGKKLESFAIK